MGDIRRRDREKMAADVWALTWQGSQAGVVEELLGAGLDQQFRAVAHAKEPALGGVVTGGLWRVQDPLWRLEDLLGGDQQLLWGVEDAGGVGGHSKTPLGGRAGRRRLVRVHPGLPLQLDGSALPFAHLRGLTGHQAGATGARQDVGSKWHRPSDWAEL